MRLLTCGSLLLASSLLAAPPLAAQSAEGETGQAPGWTFTPAVVVGWLWDSNVALVTEGFNQDIRADNLLIVTPSGAIDFLGKHTTFGAGFSGTVRRYHDVNELNSFDRRLHVGVSHRPTARLLVFGREKFARLPTTEETELNGLPFRRVGSRMNTATAGVEYRLTKFSTLRAGYELVDVAFDKTQGLPFLMVGGRSNGITSEFSRRVSERLALGALYEVRFAAIRTVSGSDQPLRFQSVGGNVQYTLGPSTTVNAAAGISTLSDPNLTDTKIGPFIRAGITHHLERATFNGSYERSFLPTFGFATSTQTEQIHGSVLMPVYRNRMYVQATTAWRRNNPLVAEESDLKSYWLSGTVGYAIARPVRIEGFYTRAWQDTRSAGGQVNRSRVGAQLVLSTPVRVP